MSFLSPREEGQEDSADGGLGGAWGRGSILSTEAVFGTLFSIILLHEVVTPRMIMGSIIIFISIIMSETKLSFLKRNKLNLESVNIEAIDED